MDKIDKQLFLDKVEFNHIIQRIKLDNDILKIIRNDISQIDFLNPQFIFKHFNSLWDIIVKSDHSNSEKLKWMKYINSINNNLDKQTKENGYEM